MCRFVFTYTKKYINKKNIICTFIFEFWIVILDIIIENLVMEVIELGEYL